MNQFITIMTYVYPILCIFAPCMVYQVVLYKKGGRSESINKVNLIWRYVFIFYLYMVMSVVGMGSIWELDKYGSIIRGDEINLIPFHSAGYMTYVLNMIMLMPLGFLLPLMWQKYRKISKVVGAGAILSLLIELGQLFNRRATDIDDLLMNTLGAFIGFGIWFVFHRIVSTKPREVRAFQDEPLTYIFAAVFGIFFLYNWRLLIKYY